MNKDLTQYWSATEERCGVILFSGEMIELENHADDKSNYFIISDEDLSQYAGEIDSSWHTHTNDSFNLSMADYDAFTDSNIANHLIISQHHYAIFYQTDDGLVLDTWGKHD